MATLMDVMKYLLDNKVDFRVLTHAPLFHAHELAHVHSVPDECVVSTRLMKAANSSLVAIVPAGCELDEVALGAALGVSRVHAATDQDLARLLPESDPVALPPFGNLFGWPVVADKRIADAGQMVFMVNVRTTSIRMAWEDFRRLAHPRVAAFAAAEPQLESI